jgi:hypothetical protein
MPHGRQLQADMLEHYLTLVYSPSFRTRVFRLRVDHRSQAYTPLFDRDAYFN